MANTQFSVSGPGYARDRLPSEAVALSAAQHGASRSDGDGTWYVRGNSSDRALYAVERRGSVIHTTATGAAS